ncbi:galactose-specific lectin nattectin-like [Rhinichthys klamathensis goyatoka]|uniref:galactose-specific lectin nattectin-like n=1 Tax=Rhinichthys klamathensis goyatoka TaxID=3034132 RepID=UPI0024B5F481|nr:galactose-specific lectin nattectin-like [Rhinichthys klamathensis goyatoka]
MAMLKSCLLLFIIFSMGNTEVTITRDVNGLDGLDVDLARRCPDTWIKSGLRCYKFFSHPAKWITAERNCQRLGANLASVRKKQENDFLLSLLPSSTPTWVGAHDAIVSSNVCPTLNGHWMWSDGTVFSYSHWCAGEPNSNPHGYYSCVEISYSSNRCWNDIGCFYSKPYICVKELRDRHADPQLL